MNYENFSAKKLQIYVFFCIFASFFVKIGMNKTLFYSKLYSWYDQNKRILPWRETADPYRIWLSEIILQQTRVAQGLSYYERFVARFDDVVALAEADEDEVMRLWQGLGYYSRCRNLHAAARIIRDLGHFPQTWEELRHLPGVGDYTAGAIASFAYNLPYPALDGNVYRVLSRIYDSEVVFDTTAGKKHFHALAEELLDRRNARLFNSAIMEFGALYCTPTSPDCAHCPLSGFCGAYASGTVELLPVRKPRLKPKARSLNYAIYISEDGLTLIHKREGNDIWKHLYEFVEQQDDELPSSLTEAERKPVQTTELTHVLSHQRIHARFSIYKVRQLPEIPGTIAIPLHSLDDYALSRLTLRALEQLAHI